VTTAFWESEEGNNCYSGGGHYTQMLWNLTTDIGCAKINCGGMILCLLAVFLSFFSFICCLFVCLFVCLPFVSFCLPSFLIYSSFFPYLILLLSFPFI
jgi:hypothetical protein